MPESEKELEVAETTNVEEVSTNTDNEEVEFTDSTNVGEEVDNTDDSAEESNNDTSSESDNQPEEAKKVQSKEDNAKFAKERREREKHDKEIQEAYKKGRLDSLKGKLNPYTNTVINDEADIEMYEAMYKLESENKDPINDYAEYVANERREQRQRETRDREIQEQAQKDVEEFSKKYPKVNLTELLEDENFSDYIEGKNKPLVVLYEGYQKLQNKFRTDSMNQARNAVANTISTPGSLNNQSVNVVDYNNMSREDFLKEVERVKNG